MRVNYQAAANYLGVKVGHLRTLVYRKQVPHIRIAGRTVVFDLGELEKWLREHSVAANQEEK